MNTTISAKSNLPGLATLPRAQLFLLYYSRIVIISVLLLIFLGALVKSHEAGLSVPDWPASYGHNMFLFPYSEWRGGIFYEHFHRLVASGVGLLTVALAIWVRSTKQQTSLYSLGYLAVALVIIQGILGGLTVLLQLPDVVSISHGILAQSFLLVLVTISFFLEKPDKPVLKLKNTTIFGLISFSVIFFQLVCGAIMRHAEAGLAVPDFPTMGGQWLPSFSPMVFQAIDKIRLNYNLPPVSNWQILTHLVHRFWSIVVLCSVLLFAVSLWRTRSQENITDIHKFRFQSLLLITLLFLQITLGIITIMSVRNVWITSAHVVLGAVLLATCWRAVLRTWTEV
jgi:heme a synthase